MPTLPTLQDLRTLRRNGPGAERVLAALRAGVGAAGADPVLVYRPFGVADAPNVYTTEPALHAAMDLVQGPFVVAFDNGPVPAPITLQSSYDFRGLGVLTVNSDILPNAPAPLGMSEVEVADGVQLRNVRGFERIAMGFNSTTVPPLAWDTNSIVAVSLGSAWDNAGTAPVFHLAGHDITLVIAGFFGAKFLHSVKAPPLIGNVTGGAQLIVVLLGVSSMDDDTLASDLDPTTQILVIYDASIGDFGGSAVPTFPRTNPLTTQVVAADTAIAMRYDVPLLNLPNWSGVAPTSVANALDRIAAKIGPIP